MGDNWRPALLLGVIIPLVLALQLMALWVIDSLNQPSSVAVATVVTPAEPVAPAEPAPPVEAPPVQEPAPAQQPEAAVREPSGSPVADTLSGWDERRNRLHPPTAEVSEAPEQAEPAPDTVAEAALAAVEDNATPDAFEPSGPVEPQPAAAPEAPHQAGWLARQDPARYTLQVETALAPERLLAVADDLDLPRPRAYYRSYWQGRDRYVYALVSGDYADWREARQAAGDLSRRHPQLKPWVRSFADIQDQLTRE